MRDCLLYVTGLLAFSQRTTRRRRRRDVGESTTRPHLLMRKLMNRWNKRNWTLKSSELYCSLHVLFTITLLCATAFVEQWTRSFVLDSVGIVK